MKFILLRGYRLSQKALPHCQIYLQTDNATFYVKKPVNMYNLKTTIEPCIAYPP